MKKLELNRINTVLKAQGRTKRWLAAQLDKNEVTVSRWCRNVQQPDLETLYRIGKLLGVHVCELLLAEMPEEGEI